MHFLSNLIEQHVLKPNFHIKSHCDPNLNLGRHIHIFAVAAGIEQFVRMSRARCHLLCCLCLTDSSVVRDRLFWLLQIVFVLDCQKSKVNADILNLFTDNLCASDP